MSQQKKYVSLSKLETYHDKLTEQIDAELQEFASEVNQAVDILSGEIDSKANATHNHKISDVTNLQNTLDSNLESANAYTDETTNALSEGFSTVIMQMYGTDVTEDGAPTIRQIAYDEANKVQTNLDALDGNFDAHLAAQNPHRITKTDIGLDNVNNTSDMAKPVSTAQQAAIDAVQEYAQGVKATADEAKTTASAAQSAASTVSTNLANHIDNKGNPHAVTKAQVGLGNVPNVTTNNQTPTYTVPTTLTGLTSGETLSTAMGKTAKAVTDFIAHNANKSNPHGVTYTQVGADKAGSAAAVQSNLDTVDDKVDDHIANDDIHFTAAERAKLSGIAENANNYTHRNSGVTAGTYKSVTVNAQGHVTGGSNPTTLAGYGITDAEAKGTVNTHNNSDVAHSDIRGDIAELAEKVANFLDVDDTTVDQLSEVIRLINENHDSLDGLIDGLALSKVNVSDIIDNLTTNVANKPLSAAQGVALKTSIDALGTNKVDKVSGKGLSTNDFTAAYKTKLDGITAGAEVNQNAFSNIKVGTTTVAADAKTDTVEFVGSNVTITPDATNDKITFAVANGTTSAAGIVQLTNSTSSTSTTTAATPSSVKSAYDLANTAKTNAATAQSTADEAKTAASNAQTTANTATTNLASHVGSTANPHSVTKGQVGLGNVPNVATNDQTPTYTAASSLAALVSGEKLSVAFGKLAKAVSDLSAHIANKSNPHAVTKAQVGLGNVDNTADVNKTVKEAGTATTLTGLTATIAELNILDGVTATAAEINKLDGLTATTAQLNKTATLSTVATSGSYTDLSNKPAIPTVYTAAQCTTYTSDSGTVTPLAVQNAAKKFAIPRITSTANAIARYSNTTGEVKNSTIKIEDVTNTRDSSQQAEIISIPAAGGTKKMVYGYCTDQVDGTSFIGGLFDADATEFPYSSGLAIGGSSGNLLWKGNKVATTSDNVASATKLATARTIRTNLGSTSTASFDGSGNVTPGVTGTLPIIHGGTGATTAGTARTALGITADWMNANHNHKGNNINPSAIEFSNASGHGGYLDFHYNNSTADYTSRIIEDAEGKINIIATNGAQINGSNIFGEHNKPYGSYTGTGEYQQITIGPVNGNDVIAISGGTGEFVILSFYGGFRKQGTSVSVVNYQTEANFSEGVLTLGSTVVNGTNKTYYYQVL